MLPKNVVLALCDFETTGLKDTDVPIEVGILFLDSELNIVGSYESLISWASMPEVTEDTMLAFRIHGILFSELSKAKNSEAVALNVLSECARHKVKDKRLILCSDNIQFEWKHMKKLLGINWPFHYCGWDTSLFLEALGVGDPKPVHRAMADVGVLYTALLKARNIVKRGF